MTTGIQLKEAMTKYGLSDVDLAHLCDVTPSWLREIKSGRQNPSPKLEHKIEEALLMFECGDMTRTVYAPVLSIAKTFIPRYEKVAVHRIGVNKAVLKELQLNTLDEITAQAARIEEFRNNIQTRKPLPKISVIQIGSDLSYLLLWGRDVLTAAQGCRTCVFLPAFVYRVDKADLPFVADLPFKPFNM